MASANSALWQAMEQLDASIELSAKREAEKSRQRRRESDDVTEHGYKLPLRVVQELSGKPVGFEYHGTIDIAGADRRRTEFP